MIVLDATTKKLEVATSAAGSLDFYACWADVTTTAFTPGANQGNVTTATTTDLVVAPGASTQRQVKTVALLNRGTATQTVTVKIDVSGTEYLLAPSIALAAGEALHYTDTDGWQVLDVAGRRKVVARDSQGIDGTPFWFYQIGTAAEAVGAWYSWHKDTGSPGSWAPGTPGVNGRATDGTAVADAGCLPIRTPASGSNYLVGFTCTSSVAGTRALVDVLWINSGLVVTTTTAQALTSVAWPARDNQGSTNGEGVYVGIMVTTATTNAAAITNTTMSYTNSDGTAGRTATISSFPATAVIGTVVWFQLAAGDKGVRSIQSVTLGTSYVTGAISIFAARILADVGNPIANIANSAPIDPRTGVRLYTGTCALLMGLMSATTATTITGTAQVAVR